MQFIEAIDEDGMPMLIGVDDDDDSVSEGSPRNKKDKKDKTKRDYNEWIKTGDQYFPAKDTKICPTLEPGHYSVQYADKRYSVLKRDIETDHLYRLPNTIVHDLVNEIGMFWDKKDLFEASGITHKRGIILAGDPGNGKTSIINQITEDVVNRKGIVFSIKNAGELNLVLDVVHAYLREIEPETPVVTVIEDIDNLVQQNESALLNFLDGEDQFDHNVIVATTNRLHELNDLLLRPSRFDKIVVLEAPSKEDRSFYLDKKGVTGDELTLWVDKSEGLSMAQLKELFIAVKLLDKSLDDAIDTLNDNSKQVSNKTFQKKAKSVGFGGR